MYSLISIKYTYNKDNISNINKASVYRYCDLLITLKLINVNLLDKQSISVKDQIQLLHGKNNYS